LIYDKVAKLGHSGFQFSLMQQVLKFVEKHGSYSPTSSGSFYNPRCTCRTTAVISSSISVVTALL